MQRTSTQRKPSLEHNLYAGTIPENHFGQGIAMTSLSRRSLRQSLTRPRHLGLTWVALACSWANALTVTGLEPQSALGEPFKAQITVTDLSDDQAASLSAALSPTAAYASVKLQRNPALNGLKATVRRTAPGMALIQLSSPHPVQSPLLDLIVDVSWSGGTLTRQFAVLMPVTAQAVSPTPGAAAEQQTTPPPPPAQPQPPQPKAEAPRAAQPVDGPVMVVQGDTLSELMLSHRYGVGTMAQRMIATQRRNQNAFIKDNINWVRAGAQLHLPSRQEILAIDAQEAQALVRTQMAAFDAYRQALAVKANTVKNQERSDQGNIEQAVQGGAQDPKGDRLALSQSNASTDAQLAEQKALAAGAAREKELQANLKDLDKIAQSLEVKNGGSNQAATGADAPGLTLTKPNAVPGSDQVIDANVAPAAGEPQWITRTKSQPWLLPVVGLLLALLALWVWIRRSNASTATDAWALHQASDVAQAKDATHGPELEDVPPTLDPVRPGPLSALLPDVDLDLPNLDDAPAPDGESLLTQAKQALREQDLERARALATQALAFEDASVQANARALLERL
jgi:FimV-like protein